MKLSTFPSLMTMAALFLCASCEPEYPSDYLCPCSHGAPIEEWKPDTDTTVINKKDTTGGFEISVDNWTEENTENIPI